MKGLLIKDIKLMKNMRNSMAMILVIAVGMGAYIKDTSFIITYLSLIGATFTSSTLSYDEFDNGYAFLFPLPVSRKGYVAEKYILGLLLSGGGWLIGSVITVISGLARNTMPLPEIFMTSVLLVSVPVFLLSVLLPFHFKFGGEKGRIVMIASMGVFFVIVVLGVKLMNMLHLDPDAVIDNMPSLGMGATAAVSIAAAALILLLSFRISMGILQKKEY